MADEIEIIYDANGQKRRLGSHVNLDGFTPAYSTFESVFGVWDDVTIRRVITAGNRVPRRHVFGPSWTQDQKSKGSCNGYALAGGLSKARYLRGIQDKLLLSGAFPYSLMNSGRDDGSLLSDGLKIIGQYGDCPESLVPWDAIYPHLQPSNARAEAAKHKGLVCYAAESMQGLRTGLAKGFIAVVAVHAGTNFQRLNSQGIAMIDSGRGNHAVHIDDLCMIAGTEVFDMNNSWGTSYGKNGRAYLAADSFSQTMAFHQFYLIGSTEEID